jgi:hypothetical protein
VTVNENGRGSSSFHWIDGWMSEDEDK